MESLPKEIIVSLTAFRSKVLLLPCGPAMVAAGAFAARDTGFLRTPLLSTWKSVWTKLPARGPTVRKSYRCSRWNGMLSAIFRWVYAGGAGPLWVVPPTLANDITLARSPSINSL